MALAIRRPSMLGQYPEAEKYARSLMCEPSIDAPHKIPFQMPPAGIDAAAFVARHLATGTKGEPRHGTTTLAFIYEAATAADKGGVVIATDSRATGGQYIGSGAVDKILDVNERIVATMAGGAADCQFWSRILAKYCSLYELREKRPISLAAASKYFCNVLYGYRGMGLSVHSLVAGVDSSGPALYAVSSEGQRVPGRLFSQGSGCLGAYGILDTGVRERMTDAEAVDLARKAIMHAAFRDCGSGGFANVVHISSAGKKRFAREDLSEMYYNHIEECNIVNQIGKLGI